MSTPNSTITQTMNVVNSSAVAVPNLSAVSVLITFPDGSTSNFVYGTGVSNMGGGAYALTYNTKGVGRVTEEWSVVGVDTTTVAQFRNEYQVAEGGS